MEDKNKCKELIGKIYVLYIKSKVVLAEAHLTRSPKLYFQKFNTKNDPDAGIDLRIDRFLTKYAREFEKTYKYFQNTKEIADSYRL